MIKKKKYILNKDLNVRNRLKKLNKTINSLGYINPARAVFLVTKVARNGYFVYMINSSLM